MMKFRNVTVSAPSKLILHGEHSVVYGKTAVAASLDLRSRMSITSNPNHDIVLHFPDIGVKDSWSVEKVQSEVLRYKPDLKDFKKTKVDPKFLEIISNFLNIEG